MAKIIRPGAGVLFMKVGTHAREPLDEIIDRKRKEIREAGFAMWGYGGNTCHPITMVQPFGSEYEARGEAIHLCMEPMDSKHFAERISADEYSVDGFTWKPIKQGIEVMGSRYALFIEELRAEAFELSLSQTQVAVGPNEGRRGHRYIQGRVDKACLAVAETAEVANEPEEERIVKIGLVAKLIKPYAAFVRTTS